MKAIPVVIGVVVLFIAGALLWAFYSLDWIVKLTLEMYGPDVLGAPVKVQHVRIEPKTGEGMLKDLEIGNPKGFSPTHALKVGEVRVSLDPATVTSKVIYVREIAVEAPLITYERGRDATNLDTIQRNIDAYVKKSASAAEADSKAPGAEEDPRRFIVERISIRGARVTMTAPGLKGQGVAFDLPEVQLKAVGKRQNGLRASEIANLIARELISKIGQRVLTNIELLKKGGATGAIDALKGIFK